MARKRKPLERNSVEHKQIRIYNASFQGLEVHYKTKTKPETEWLPPQKSFIVEEWQVTDQIKNLLRRKVLEFRRP